jgi:hypothetical protein
MLASHLKEWLADQKKELVEQTIKLISEDAPKNKFSIITGKMKMIEEFESEIENFERKRLEIKGTE